jgi:hypothetical protein
VTLSSTAALDGAQPWIAASETPIGGRRPRPTPRLPPDPPRHRAELVRWDEYDAAAAMPADLRPEVERPTLSRGALTELRRMLAGVIDQFEEAWERRN